MTRLPVPASTTADYITADDMEATFEEKGITIQGRQLTWLQVACIGQGQPNGTGTDRNGIPEDKYHLFLCNGTLSNGRTAIIHVQIYKSPGHPDQFLYRYQVVNVL